MRTIFIVAFLINLIFHIIKSSKSIQKFRDEVSYPDVSLKRLTMN